MAAIVNVSNEDFINISYIKIIDEIIRCLDSNTVNILTKAGYHVVNVPKLAEQVAKNLNEQPIENILNITNRDGSSNIFSTLAFKDELLESKKIKELKEYLRGVVANLDIHPAPHDLYISNKNKDIHWQRDVNLGMNLGNFESKAEINELSSSNSNSDTQVRQDRVEIHIDITNLENDIMNSLVNYYSKKFSYLDEDELEYKIECIKNDDSLMKNIRDLVLTYRNGYLKRVIEGPLYLDFINEVLLDKKMDVDFPNAYKLYSNYRSRVYMFEKFIQNSIVNDGDDLYHLEYLGNTLDFIHYVKTNSVYSCLPFVGVIGDASLVDARTSDRMQGAEIYGFHLKRNGEVKSSKSETALAYYCTSLLAKCRRFEKIKSQNTESEFKKINIEKECDLKKHGKDFIEALMYKYMFVNLEDENYDAIGILKADLLKYKSQKLNKPESIINAIYDLVGTPVYNNREKVKSQMSEIKGIIEGALKNNSKAYEKEYIKKFSLLNAVLPKDEDLSDGILLDCLRQGQVENINKYNKLFKYITLLDEDLDENCYTYSFDYRIKFRSESFLKPNNTKIVTIKYNTENFNPFNIVFYPTLSTITGCSEIRAKEIMAKFRDNEIRIGECKDGKPCLFIDYDNDYLRDFDGMECENKKVAYKFVYDTAYTFIITTLVSLVSEKLSEKLFESKLKQNPNLSKDSIEDMRQIEKSIHLMFEQLTFNTENKNKAQSNNGIKKENEVKFTEAQTFIRKLRKSLAGSVSSNHRSGSQGFNVLSDKYKAQNSINSLFSRVTRTVELHRDIKVLNKTAIIVASARYCDKGRNRNRENTNLYFEIITVDKIGDKKINVTSYGEYTKILPKEDLYKNPTILADKVCELEAMGYKDIIYLAKSPYTTTMLEKKDKTEMYFMNEEVIKHMVNNTKNVKIYPLYMNTAKVSIGELKNTAGTNIISAKSICSGLGDELEGIIPLFQVFSDNSVDKSERSFYNESILYSTIRGIYSNEVKSFIRQNELLENYGENNYVYDLQLIMISIHLVRNEKYAYGNTNLKTIKNNPFKNILDMSEGVSGISEEEYFVRGSRGLNISYKMNRFALTSYIYKVLSNQMV